MLVNFTTILAGRSLFMGVHFRICTLFLRILGGRYSLSSFGLALLEVFTRYQRRRIFITFRTHHSRTERRRPYSGVGYPFWSCLYTCFHQVYTPFSKIPNCTCGCILSWAVRFAFRASGTAAQFSPFSLFDLKRTFADSPSWRFSWSIIISTIPLEGGVGGRCATSRSLRRGVDGCLTAFIFLEALVWRSLIHRNHFLVVLLWWCFFFSFNRDGVLRTRNFSPKLWEQRERNE